MNINKYYKYKNKYLKLKKLIGGNILPNDVLNYIESIGFEFEVGSINPLIKTTNGEDYHYKIFDFHSDRFKIVDTNDVEFIMIADTVSKRRNEDVDYIKLFDKTNDSKIIYIKTKTDTYKCKYEKIQNLEFIITFKNIKPSNNIIKEKYEVAVDMLRTYLIDKNERYNENVEIYIDNKPDRNIPSQIIKYDIGSSNIILLSSNWLSKFRVPKNLFNFNPQCTIKIKYEHVIKVIYYINETIFMYKIENSSITINIIQFVKKLTLLCHDILNSNKLPLLDCDYIYLENWFVLVILYLKFYGNYKKKYNGMNLFKDSCIFFIRHSMYKLCPLTIEQKQILINETNFSELIEKIPNLYEYVEILFLNDRYNDTKNLKFGYDEQQIQNVSTMFETDNMKTYNQFIYVEYRYLIHDIVPHKIGERIYNIKL